VLVVDANVVVEVTLERFGATALDALGDESRPGCFGASTAAGSNS
jgi:hypothetical protein